MRPHPPTTPLPPGYPNPPPGTRPAHGNGMGGSHTQLSRQAAPMPPSIPGLNRAKMEQHRVPLHFESGNNPQQLYSEPTPPGQLPAANRYDRSQLYKPTTKFPDINDNKPKHPRKLISIDGSIESAEGGQELKFPSIPGAEVYPPTGCLQPIPRARQLPLKGHTFQAPHLPPALPANPKKQTHRVRQLHSQLQKVSSLMEAGPGRAPTPFSSASFVPPCDMSRTYSNAMKGIYLDLPSPVSAPNASSPPNIDVFKTATHEKIVLSPSELELSPAISESISNKSLENVNGVGAFKPQPPKNKSGNQGTRGGGAARRRHYRK